MKPYRFYHPIEVRYGDLDPQGHVNNARFLTYMEQARVAYFKHLGLWDGGSFMDFGVILAEVRVTFRAPIHWGDALHVGMGTTRLGTKSLTTGYLLENMQDGNEFASGTAVMVAYDYHQACTVPIPHIWRQTIIDFEGLEQPLVPLDES